MRIVVLAGGLSMERNVSLSSGNKICRALRSRGHQAILVDMFMGFEDYDGKLEDVFDTPDGFCGDYSVAEAEPDLAAVRASRKDQSKSLFGPGVLDVCAKADIVFLALHGTCGEDGRVQAAFDLLGIPYTGAGYLSSAIAMDKDLTKRLVSEYVITPQWRTVRYTEGDIARLASETKLPCVVKPVANGSSVGVSIAHTGAELKKRLKSAYSSARRSCSNSTSPAARSRLVSSRARHCPPSKLSRRRAFMTMRTSIRPARRRKFAPLPSPRTGRCACAPRQRRSTA